MPKTITVTYTFEDEAEVLAFLQGREKMGGAHAPVPHVTKAPVKETPHPSPVHKPHGEAHEGPTSAASAAASGQTAPQPSTAASPSSGPTQEDVRNAFTRYVQKGGGRTAATGKKILEQHGVASIREAPEDKWGALIAAFDEG